MDRNHSVIFFGSFGQYSADFLREICSKYAVKAVVTASPKPAGRHLKITPTLVEDFARSQNIPIFYDFKNLPACDFILVAGYGKLITESAINLPKILAINFHPSLLPNYSGSTPVEYALLNGETETGITFIKIAKQFDTGDIIYQEKVPILESDNRLTLYKKLFDLGAQKSLDLLSQDHFDLTPQNKTCLPAGRSKKLTRQDGFIEYSQINSPEAKIKQKAFTGFPGTWTIDPSGNRLKLS